MDKNDAEDVVQELFLNLWKNREKIEIRENVSGYLYRMAKHMALNFIRSKVQTGSLSENQDLSLLFYEDNRLETEEFRIALYDCIDHLPEQRSVTSSQGKRIETERNIGETIYIREDNQESDMDVFTEVEGMFGDEGGIR